MPSSRSIAAFAVKFLVIYGALAASWPLCRPAYAFFLRESGKVLFNAVGARNHVHIRAATVPDGMNDTVLSVRVTAAGKALKITISSWLIGFQPTSLLIALVVATPVSMRRRVWALFAGLVMVHAFVLARLTTFVILAPVVLPDTFWTKALRWSVFDFIHGPAVSCFVPVLIWLAVTMRREDARRLGGSTQKKVTA
jgi:hypothetical protein